MPTQTVTLSVISGTDNFNITQSITNDQSKSIDLILAAATVNAPEVIVLTRAQIKGIVLQAIGGDVTIKTNSTSSPGDTVVMTAGQVIYWCPSGSGIVAFGSDPFPTADVTELFLSSTAGATFKLRAVVTASNG